jgi:ERF superfamily
MKIADIEAETTDLEAQLRASLNGSRKKAQVEPEQVSIACGRLKGRTAKTNEKATDSQPEKAASPAEAELSAPNETSARAELRTEQLTLRRKLGEVRRRIGYIQKRGYNERENYNYVAAADIAGTIGDILAELGVVVIPRLESISYEPHAPGRLERVARVIMSYAFTDEDSGDEITAKVAGEGLDIGDKASYKAMTGALKYALLQSFLLATGDDPEDERAESRWNSGSDHQISAEQQDEIRALIENTGTDPERVCAYYKISALAEMTESTFRRAVDLLKRKLDKQRHGDGGHAQN